MTHVSFATSSSTNLRFAFASLASSRAGAGERSGAQRHTPLGEAAAAALARLYLAEDGRTTARRVEPAPGRSSETNALSSNALSAAPVAQATASGSWGPAAPVRRTADVPEEYICPITTELMTDPVMVVESGMTYERKDIERWLEEHNTDPNTGVTLEDKRLAPNHALRSQCIESLRRERHHHPVKLPLHPMQSFEQTESE